MKIRMNEYSRVVDTYELELDAKYVAELNNYLQERCVEKDRLPYLESEDIVYIFENKWCIDNPELEKEYHWYYPNGHNSNYSETLADFVYYLVEEDLWNSDVADHEYLDREDIEIEILK